MPVPLWCIKSISVLHFSPKLPLFSPNDNFFLQNTWIVPWNSPVQMDRMPDRTYPILETFLFLITKRRFGGVGAPEGREIEPAESYKFFFPKYIFSLQNLCFCLFITAKLSRANPAQPKYTTIFSKMRLFSPKCDFNLQNAIFFSKI